MRFPSAVRSLACCGLWLGLLCAVACGAEPEAKYDFDVPAGAAETTLKTFSEQCGRSLIVATRLTDGVQTHPIRGRLTAIEALDRMLAGTGLEANEDLASRAFTVRQAKTPPNRNLTVWPWGKRELPEAGLLFTLPC